MKAPTTKRAAYAYADGAAFRLTAKALRAIVAGAYFTEVARELKTVPATISTDDEDGRWYSNTPGVQCVHGYDLDAGEAAYMLDRLTRP